MKTVCVVGAGPAGLVSAKALLEAGLEVDCYEISSAIGGHWVIDNPNGRAAAYASLETNTTRRMSRLSDFEMPDEAPEFPGHARVRDWFESYVDAFGFRDRIQLGHEVVSARPLDPTGWQVQVRDTNGRTRDEHYDALLACSGSYWFPRLPDVPGNFGGERMHAREYRDPDTPVATRGKRVVVVGNGNRRPFTEHQLRELVSLVQRIQARLGIPPDRVLLHDELPGGLDSPGDFFPAARFRQALLPAAR